MVVWTSKREETMPQRKRKTANKKKTRRAKAPEVSRVEGRYHMVEEAAYFKAEKEGFQGDPAHYWIAAEAEIDTMLTKKKK